MFSPNFHTTIIFISHTGFIMFIVNEIENIYSAVHPCISGRYVKNRHSHQGSTIPIFGKSELIVVDNIHPVKAKNPKEKYSSLSYL